MTIRSRLRGSVGDDIARRFMGMAGFSLVLRIAWAVSSYAGVVLLARWLAPQAYGVFAIVLSLVVPLSIVCAMGLPTAGLRFLGQYQAQGRFDLAKGLTIFSRTIILRVAILAMLLLIVSVWVLYGAGRISDPVAYSLGFLLLPLYTMMGFQSSLARAHGGIFTALAPRDVLWRALLIPIGYVASWQAYADQQALVLFIAASATLAGLGLIQKQRVAAITPAPIQTADTAFDRPAWRKAALPMWVSASAVALAGNVDVLAVGAFLSEADAGRYFLVQRTAALASFVLVSINLIIGPEVAKLYYAGERGKLDRLLGAASVLALLPSLVALAVFVAAGRWLLGFAGPQASALYAELMVLGVGQCINAATGSVGVVLNMIGAERVAAWIRLAFVAVGGAAMAAAAYFYGTMGAALAAAATIGGSNLVLALYCRRAFGIDASAFALIVPPAKEPLADSPRD